MGEVNGERATTGLFPYIFYTTVQGVFTLPWPGDDEYIQLPDSENLQGVTHIPLWNDMGRFRRILRTGYNSTVETMIGEILAGTPDGWEIERSFAIQSTSRPGPYSCATENATEGDLCPIDAFSYQLPQFLPGPDGVWALYERTRWTGELRYDCEEFLGDFPCGWLGQLNDAQELVVRYIPFDTGSAEQSSLVVPLDGRTKLAAKLGPDGRIDIATTEIALGKETDQCTVRYLKLQCDIAETDPVTEPTGQKGFVKCGAENCDLATDICVGCRDYQNNSIDVHCSAIADGAPFFGEAGANHGVCDYGSLEIRCDGNEDCQPGEACSAYFGEWGHTACEAVNDNWTGLCEKNSDCPEQTPVCKNSPVEYFSDFSELLGWQPQACFAE